jgi:hypothetical protein
MLKTYRSYLDYKEIRRRVEGKLQKSRGLLIHILIFLAANIGLWIVSYPTRYDPIAYNNVFMAGVFTAAWSAVLLLHALGGFFHSGLWPSARETAIEAEMSALLADSLDSDDEDFFQIHRMLDNDIWQRSGYLFSLSIFAISNVFIWMVWVLAGAALYNSVLWFGVIFAAMIFVAGGGILNFWRRGKREQRRIQDNMPPARDSRAAIEPRYFATPEHGRLEIMDDSPPVFEKNKRH